MGRPWSSAFGLALFLLGSLIIHADGQSQSLETDLYALLKIREAFIDTQSILREWTFEKSAIICAWRGVICKDGRVSELSLPGARLQGHISGAQAPLPSFLLFVL